MPATNQLLTQRSNRCHSTVGRRKLSWVVRASLTPDHIYDPPSRSGCAAVGSESRPESNLSQTQIFHLDKASKLLAVTAVAYHIAFSCNAARAEDRPWKPRRHHRRMGERFTNYWAEELVEEWEGAREKRLEEVRLERLRLAELREADHRRIRDEEEALKRRAQEIMIREYDAARTGGLPFKLMFRGTDFAPLVVWSGILAALVAAYRSRLLTWLMAGPGRRATGGKWVYDRSLGGRKVWVPDSSSFAGPTSATSLSEKAGRSLKDEEFERLASFAAAARTAPASETTTSSAGTFSLPPWWDTPPVLYASPAKKTAKAEEAARLLSRLESAKVAGRDYELDDIRALRRTCQDGHVSVKPKTVGGRDAIYRTAVEAAVEAAQSRNSDTLDGVSPPRWVAGVAADLSMEDQRAVGIVAAVAASAVRARLLDAVTCLRSGNTSEAVYALARMASLLELLPVLQPGAVQVEAVASSLRDRSSVSERQMMFHLLAQLYEEGAEVAAELLGFDPALVLAEQRVALDAARQERRREDDLETAAAAATAIAETATEGTGRGRTGSGGMSDGGLQEGSSRGGMGDRQAGKAGPEFGQGPAAA
ncbi:hypothetical protein Vretimale_10668 [Volvox reticuliferus]|uniref:Uncharacterized protein n=1 Tax=Volvox reticuliferus TaxID=1737510 RepID=A0A8J4FV14_9CHLO|nr:hypothetical protein Vretifemale_13928 [Volvox reticuliferus]GIM06331.1 hypothetical protein Vretimale_10668 [Volvox reticuliferus]